MLGRGPAARWHRGWMSWRGTSDASFFAWHSPLRCEASVVLRDVGLAVGSTSFRRRLAGLYHRLPRAVNPAYWVARMQPWPPPAKTRYAPPGPVVRLAPGTRHPSLPLQLHVLVGCGERPAGDEP